MVMKTNQRQLSQSISLVLGQMLNLESDMIEIGQVLQLILNWHQIRLIQQLLCEVTVVHVTVLSVAYLNAMFQVFLICPMLLPY